MHIVGGGVTGDHISSLQPVHHTGAEAIVNSGSLRNEDQGSIRQHELSSSTSSLDAIPIIEDCADSDISDLSQPPIDDLDSHLQRILEHQSSGSELSSAPGSPIPGHGVKKASKKDDHSPGKNEKESRRIAKNSSHVSSVAESEAKVRPAKQPGDERMMLSVSDKNKPVLRERQVSSDSGHLKVHMGIVKLSPAGSLLGTPSDSSSQLYYDSDECAPRPLAEELEEASSRLAAQEAENKNSGQDNLREGESDGYSSSEVGSEEEGEEESEEVSSDEKITLELCEEGHSATDDASSEAGNELPHQLLSALTPLNKRKSLSNSTRENGQNKIDSRVEMQTPKVKVQVRDMESFQPLSKEANSSIPQEKTPVQVQVTPSNDHTQSNRSTVGPEPPPTSAHLKEVHTETCMHQSQNQHTLDNVPELKLEGILMTPTVTRGHNPQPNQQLEETPGMKSAQADRIHTKGAVNKHPSPRQRKKPQSGSERKPQQTESIPIGGTRHRNLHQNQMPQSTPRMKPVHPEGRGKESSPYSGHKTSQLGLQSELVVTPGKADGIPRDRAEVSRDKNPQGVESILQSKQPQQGRSPKYGSTSFHDHNNVHQGKKPAAKPVPSLRLKPGEASTGTALRGSHKSHQISRLESAQRKMPPERISTRSTVSKSYNPSLNKQLHSATGVALDQPERTTEVKSYTDHTRKQNHELKHTTRMKPAHPGRVQTGGGTSTTPYIMQPSPPRKVPHSSPPGTHKTPFPSVAGRVEAFQKNAESSGKSLNATKNQLMEGHKTTEHHPVEKVCSNKQDDIDGADAHVANTSSSAPSMLPPTQKYELNLEDLVQTESEISIISTASQNVPVSSVTDASIHPSISQEQQSWLATPASSQLLAPQHALTAMGRPIKGILKKSNSIERGMSVKSTASDITVITPLGSEVSSESSEEDLREIAVTENPPLQSQSRPHSVTAPLADKSLSPHQSQVPLDSLQPTGNQMVSLEQLAETDSESVSTTSDMSHDVEELDGPLIEPDELSTHQQPVSTSASAQIAPTSLIAIDQEQRLTHEV